MLKQSIRVVLLLSLALAVNAGEINLPSLGDRSSALVSPQQEQQLGALWLRRLRQQSPVIDDPFLNQYINDLVNRLIPHSDLIDRNTTQVIVDSPQLNAFAVPGGIIGINLGLLLYSDNEDQLISVLAHEIAHLSQRHYARRVEQSSQQTPVAIAALLASVLLIASNNADAGLAGIATSQAASIQQQLGFSRDFEREADRVGMALLKKAGWSPQQMPQMFRNMLAAARFRGSPPEFLLTHPLTESRVADAEGRAALQPLVAASNSMAFIHAKLIAHYRYQWQRLRQPRFLEQWLQIAEQSLSSIGLSDPSLNWLNPNDPIHQTGVRLILARWYLDQGKLSKAVATINQLAVNTLDYPLVIATIQTIQHNIAQLPRDPAVQLQPKLVSRTQQWLSRAITNWPLTLYQQSSLDFTTAEIVVNELRRQGNKQLWQQTLRALTQQFPEVPYWWQQLARDAADNNDLPLSYRAKAEDLFLHGNVDLALQQLELAIGLANKQGLYKIEAAYETRLAQMRTSLRRFPR